MLKSQRGELSELYNDGDDGKIKAMGVKCERRSQLPQTTMDVRNVTKIPLFSPNFSYLS